MRVTCITCLVVLMFAESFAQDQIKHGVYSLGGSISYSSLTMKYLNDETTISTYAIAPSISYFFIDQCELSFDVGYTVTSGDYFETPAKSKSLALALGMRFYFPLGTVAPFLGASGQISWTTPYFDSSQPFQSPITGYNITGGLEIFIAPSAAIEPAVVYSRTRIDAQYSRNVFLVGIGAKYFIL